MNMPDMQDVSWTHSEVPEFEQQDDVNDRVDEPGGIEEDD
jgi:hypothetical protein